MRRTDSDPRTSNEARPGEHLLTAVRDADAEVRARLAERGGVR